MNSRSPLLIEKAAGGEEGESLPLTSRDFTERFEKKEEKKKGGYRRRKMKK